MGIFDMFKKKDETEDLSLGDLDKELGADLGLGNDSFDKDSGMQGLGPMSDSETAQSGADLGGPYGQQNYGSGPTPRTYPGAESPDRPSFAQEPSLKPAPLERPTYRELPPQDSQPRYSSTSNDMYKLQKDVEVLSSKIDAIRSALESISQRIVNIERLVTNEKERQRRTW